ncbi:MULTISPECIES: GNAT family N-acetyltransferase [Fusobacterium]|uniref:GNAT family N-acetyltransferase n=1 Tax=Fusobacterium TaxID=848 RepID=UPI000B92BC6A|nr:GNAT family N-acetyltransferase [Fusobacterium sp. oral taxon 203]ASS38744.1 acetyltransferase [Fusobacterium sp. oral taxon 203]
MNILIREATEIDYPAINKMLLKLQNYHSKNVPTIYKKLDTFFTFNEYLKILEDRNVYFILATLDNKVIGLIWLSFNEKLSKYEYQRKQIWIEGIYIKTKYRRKGIAQKLVNEAINKAKFLNAQSIELMIWNFNETSKKFFEIFFKVRSLVLTKEL